ncbi:AmmeMemoRadiSam system radical SAM enzyme [Myxococcota bacterium]
MSQDDWDRRCFMLRAAGGAAAFCIGGRAVAEDRAEGSSVLTTRKAGLALHRARWWKSAGEQGVRCGLCPHSCRVADGERGLCGVRENREGRYYTLVYGRPGAVHLDPIEKKPFYHVLPGQTALSLGAPGCNLECRFCQNWDISQARPEEVRTYLAPPEQIVALAKKRKAPTIACTYSEPTVWAEFVLDIGRAAQKAGLRTLMVSNGFIQAQPMTDLQAVLSAVKIDLKAFTSAFYRRMCRGQLRPVLDTLRLLAKRGTWTEIVVLTIPGHNDTEREIRGLARFVRSELGPDVPLHFSRFRPAYRLKNVPRTPITTLERARHVAQDEGLRFVYVGNVPGHPANHTYCPGCQNPIIRRTGMAVLENQLANGECPHCSRRIPGIWK